MRRLFLILGLILSLCPGTKAEIYRDIDVDMVYKNGTFKDKAEVKKLIDEYTQRDTPNDPKKTWSVTLLMIIICIRNISR